MSRSHSKSTVKKAGLAPGTLVFTGDRKVNRPHVIEMIYNENECKERNIDTDHLLTIHAPTSEHVTWYDIKGLHNVDLIETIGKFFKIHYLALEDIANTRQVAKIEEYDNGVFIIVNALTESPNTNQLATEQVAIYVGADFVLSFQEDEFDQFHLVRTKLKEDRGHICSKKSEYLAYTLLDMIVDNYIESIGKIESELYELENDIIFNPVFKNKIRLYEFKQQLLIIRKTIYPLREALSRVMRIESSVFQNSIKLYIRDLYDHTHQVIDKADYLREIVTNLQETYTAELNNKTNHVIRVLTIISTIFMPLTFIVGVYGMNFRNMPELEWTNGYYYCLVFMGIVFLFFLYYFKRKKWL
jgi:magnesium transporter